MAILNHYARYHRHIFLPVFHVKYSRPLIHNPPPQPIIHRLNNPRDNTYRTATIATSHYHARYHRHIFLPLFHGKHSQHLVHNSHRPTPPRSITGTSIHEQAYNRSDSNNPFIYRREFIPVFHVKHSRHCHSSSSMTTHTTQHP